MRLLRIVQETQNRWRIENARGDILLNGLMIESTYRATEYIKGYISSFLCYGYEVIPLKKDAYGKLIREEANGD